MSHGRRKEIALTTPVGWVLLSSSFRALFGSFVLFSVHVVGENRDPSGSRLVILVEPGWLGLRPSFNAEQGGGLGCDGNDAMLWMSPLVCILAVLRPLGNRRSIFVDFIWPIAYPSCRPPCSHPL